MKRPPHHPAFKSGCQIFDNAFSSIIPILRMQRSLKRKTHFLWKFSRNCSKLLSFPKNASSTEILANYDHFGSEKFEMFDKVFWKTKRKTKNYLICQNGVAWIEWLISLKILSRTENQMNYGLRKFVHSIFRFSLKHGKKLCSLKWHYFKFRRIGH